VACPSSLQFFERWPQIENHRPNEGGNDLTVTPARIIFIPSGRQTKKSSPTN
jgi:hypothetical protein